MNRISGVEIFAEINERFSHLLTAAPFMSSIASEQDYNDALQFAEDLLRDIRDNRHDPRNTLLDFISLKIETYEYQTHPALSQWDRQDGVVALLRILMRQHDLKQTDLPEIGSQGVVSEILNNKRKLNLTQIQKLATRFQLPINLFLPTDNPH